MSGRRPKQRSSEENERQLAKLARRVLALADEAGRELERSGQRTTRLENNLMKRASGILIDSLEFGGPKDAKLRLIVQSYALKPPPHWDCFYHVCTAWRPLTSACGKVNFRNPLDVARALRILARGVSEAVDSEPSSA